MARNTLNTVLFSVLILGQSTLTWAATLTSTVDRAQLSTNETVSLTVTYDEKVDSSKLVYQVLEKDFEILSVTPHSTSSISVANGRAERVSNSAWAITLTPKREGELVIPAFSIDSNASQAIRITVDNATQKNESRQEPLRAVLIASSDTVYPSQQLLVEIEISAQSNIGNLNGPELVVRDARVEALDQKNFQRVDNGVARQIVVLKYAVFAEKPGELILPRLTYSAVKGGQRGFFGSQGQKVVARTEQLAITVKERPNDTTSPWFTADNVSIRSQWSSDIKALKVGEPITRTITIAAQGQQAEAIPPLSNSNKVDGVKSYKDQPQLHTQATDKGFVGTRIESSAIVVSKAGSLTFPAVSLRWWNTKTEQWEQATLARETVAASGVPLIESDQKNDFRTTSADDNGKAINGQSNSNPLVQSLIAAVAALALICLTQFWFIFNLRKPATQTELKGPADPTEVVAWRQLQEELKSGQPLAIRKALLVWAKTFLPTDQVPSVQAIVHSANEPQLEEQVLKLDQALYKGDTDFDPTLLTTTLERLRKAHRKLAKTGKTASNSLKPLYAKANAND